MNLGSAVKELRVRADMSQGELAIKSKLTQGYVSNVERGRQHPTKPVLKRIAKALKVPLPLLQIMSIDFSSVSEKYKRVFSTIELQVEDIVNDALYYVYGPR